MDNRRLLENQQQQQFLVENTSIQKQNRNKDDPGQLNQIDLNQEKTWLTEAYRDFQERLCYNYLVAHDITEFDKLRQTLKMIPGNTDKQSLCCLEWASYLTCCLIAPIVYYKSRVIFEVEKNHFAFVITQEGQVEKTVIYGPGFHKIGMFNTLQGIYSFSSEYRNGLIESQIGDLMIAKVAQGTIMHLDCGGQNIILGPGIHCITEPMVFKKIVNLDSFYIEIGPEKWVTVPSGYDGISINRGQIKILEGGKQHHLPHIGDKFVKMVPKTLQTDRVPSNIPEYLLKLQQGKPIQEESVEQGLLLKTTTSEGATVHLDCMIFWQVVDTELAARTAIQFLDVGQEFDPESHTHHAAIKAASENIQQLRGTILRIAKNHLTALVGTCSISGKVALQSTIQQQGVTKNLQEGKGDNEGLLEEISKKNEPILQQMNQDIKTTIQNQPQQIQQQYQLPNNMKQMPSPQPNKNFEILHFLQDSCTSIKDQINAELSQIGAFLLNICIFTVIPTKDIQQELDKQTKAKVDANTAMIQVLAKQQSQIIEQQIEQQRAYQNAQNEQYITTLRAETQLKVTQNEVQISEKKTQQEASNKLILAQNEIEISEKRTGQEAKNKLTIAENDIKISEKKTFQDAKNKIALAESESKAIIEVAKARKQEAQELESTKIAQDLERIRVAGLAGEKIFQGKTSFVYAKEPGDILYSMVQGLGRPNQLNN